MIIYQAPTVTIEYKKEQSQIVQKWKGFSSSDVFREAIKKTVEFARVNQVSSVISDCLEQSILRAEDIEFAVEGMPQLANGNIKAMAFIMPKNLFAQLSVQKFGKQSKVDMINYFDSYETAQEWIDTMVVN